MDKFVTVVFKVDDWERFQAKWNLLCDSARDKSDVEGAVVCGLSRCDEMSKAEQLEDLLVENGIEVPKK